jgi:hypothetical protein
MKRKFLETTPLNRTYCSEGEGSLAAAQIMTDHRLREVLVVNSSGEIVGKYRLDDDAIRLYPQRTT